MPGGLRIGVNALYLIPGAWGTEIYLRSLLQAMSEWQPARILCLLKLRNGRGPGATA